MRALVIPFTLLIAAWLPTAHANTKQAEQLTAMCSSTNETNQQRCLGYIQGYLDSTGAVEEEDAMSAWTKRAIKTRVGSRYDRPRSPEYCIEGDDAIPRLKALVSEVSADEGAAPHLLERLLVEQFPCSQS